MEPSPRWTALDKDDSAVEEELRRLLQSHPLGDAYGEDGTFAANLAKRPRGRRAMAATHCLDVSLTMDGIPWHFSNFGEPGLVTELADCFVEARDFMAPLLANRTEADGDPSEMPEQAGVAEGARAIDRRAWTLGSVADESAIYQSWIRYARQHPDQIFE